MRGEWVGEGEERVIISGTLIYFFLIGQKTY